MGSLIPPSPSAALLPELPIASPPLSVIPVAPSTPPHQTLTIEPSPSRMNGTYGTRYVCMTGYLSPPELSAKPVVRMFLQQIFPCPYGGWFRKRGDRVNVSFKCGCPVPNLIRPSLAVHDQENVIHYYVPSNQGIPHDSLPLHHPSDSMNPWEIELIKEIVDAQPNLQPMIAYDLWTKSCSNQVDCISRCPDLSPRLSPGAVPRRSLHSISIIFPLFLGFFRYNRKRHRLLLRELGAPPTSVAFLWSFQTKHSFWDHLQMIEKLHQFKPMPTNHFSTINDLAAYLPISPTIVFTIPVESSDLDDLDLPSDQKIKAFGSLFCFGLPHCFVDSLSLFAVRTTDIGPYFLISQGSPKWAYIST
jgi:hypothetical protein